MRLSLIVSFALAASTLIAQPVITANGVLNASGYQTTLAPDTVFVIFGAAMGPASIATASAPDYPTMLSGTSITFTPAAGGGAVWPGKWLAFFRLLSFQERTRCAWLITVNPALLKT
jgi:hypothetical protein